MKSLVLILMLPALMLIGCGKMQTNETSASNAIQGLSNEGAISIEEAESIDEGLLEEEVQLTETDQANSIMLKLGGAELLIDFLSDLSGDPEETAMVINGVEVPTGIAADSGSFQGLIASLVAGQLEGVDLFGIPATDLVDVGLGLISGDTKKANFSNLFGTLVRGALNLFLSGTPYGAIFNVIAGPILDNVLGNGSGNQNSGSNNNSNNSNNNNDSGGFLDTIVNTIGGVLDGGSSSPLGGIFNLITNLFK